MNWEIIIAVISALVGREIIGKVALSFMEGKTRLREQELITESDRLRTTGDEWARLLTKVEEIGEKATAVATEKIKILKKEVDACKAREQEQIEINAKQRRTNASLARRIKELETRVTNAK